MLSFRLDNEDQENLGNCALCVDPEYNVLWSYTPNSLNVSCYNPIAAEVKGQLIWIDGWMNGWMDEWTDRWMEGRMDGCNIQKCTYKHKNDFYNYEI